MAYWDPFFPSVVSSTEWLPLTNHPGRVCTVAAVPPTHLVPVTHGLHSQKRGGYPGMFCVWYSDDLHPHTAKSSLSVGRRRVRLKVPVDVSAEEPSPAGLGVGGGMHGSPFCGVKQLVVLLTTMPLSHNDSTDTVYKAPKTARLLLSLLSRPAVVVVVNVAWRPVVPTLEMAISFPALIVTRYPLSRRPPWAAAGSQVT